MKNGVDIIESFVSWQGEGSNCGKRMIILRYKNCNRVIDKKPCPFCDTLVQMRVKSNCFISYQEIQKIIDQEKCNIMITGGEPTYDTYFQSTIELMLNLKFNIMDIESNGYDLVRLINYIHDNNLNDKISGIVNYIYSPKIFNDEELNLEKERTLKLIDLSLLNNITIKYVVSDSIYTRQYLDFLSEICDKENCHNIVYLMPLGKNRDELIKNSDIVFDMCEEYKFNFSSRDHVIYQFI